MSYQDKKEQLKGLIEKSAPTPTQKVEPIKDKEETYHINARIPTDLEFQLKTYCLKKKTNIKEVLIIALTEYLERNEMK